MVKAKNSAQGGKLAGPKRGRLAIGVGIGVAARIGSAYERRPAQAEGSRTRNARKDRPNMDKEQFGMFPG